LNPIVLNDIYLVGDLGAGGLVIYSKVGGVLIDTISFSDDE